jgi:hypothetical protein
MRKPSVSSRANHLLHWARPGMQAGLVLLACLLAAAEETSRPLISGPQAGDRVATFYVRAITGPHRNKSVCYVCRNGDRPVVMLFAREVTPEVRRLLKEIDTQVDAHRALGLRAFCVFHARDGRDLLPVVQTVAFEEKIELPLTIAAAAVDGPAGQNLHPDASVTAILYREQTVAESFAWRPGELTPGELTRLLKSVKELAEKD